jgi:hypothetical protein
MGFYVEYSIYDQVCEHVRECPDTVGCIPGVYYFVIVLYQYVGDKLGYFVWCYWTSYRYTDEL